MKILTVILIILGILVFLFLFVYLIAFLFAVPKHLDRIATVLEKFYEMDTKEMDSTSNQQIPFQPQDIMNMMNQSAEIIDETDKPVSYTDAFDDSEEIEDTKEQESKQG